MALVLDVFSDIACPWCLIGKRRLARALEGREGAVRVRWRAYQLMPELPPEGTDAATLFARKFGGPQQMRAMFERVEGIARAEGLDVDLAAQPRVPNSRLAHRVLQLAQAAGHGDAAVEALFQGQFVERVDVTRVEVLDDLLARHAPAVDRTVLLSALADGGGAAEVDADLALARRLGVTGVPFFVGNGAFGLSGAQEVETFRRFLDEAARHAPVDLDAR